MADKTDKDMKRLKNIVGKVAEDSKIRLDQMIKDFLAHSELKEVTFPNQLSSMERAYVHYQATKHGLQSASTGVGSERRLTLRRVKESTSIGVKSVAITQESLEGMRNLEYVYPAKDVTVLDSGRERDNISNRQNMGRNNPTRLSAGPTPKVPKRRRSNAFVDSRMRLPIWRHQAQILKTIEDNKVLFIRGSTGCGKTTQVGQFILDMAFLQSKEVRIICTVPRRIAAISVSERVSLERGEKIGQTVGYQIRLESCLSPSETLLTYCTSGVLLRSLSSADYQVLRNTTHIIIDEIHERDRQTDFLLACLRDILGTFPNLRLILMGANLDNELFASYFGRDYNCPIIDVEGRLFPVEVHYLDDILDDLSYENHDMQCSRREEQNKSDPCSRIVSKLTKGKGINEAMMGMQLNPASAPNVEVDNMIKKFWTHGDETIISNFVEMVEQKKISVNYQHSIVGVTMLMAVAVRGLQDLVETLIRLGADVSLNCKIGNTDIQFSAIDWASDHRQHEVLKILLEHQYQTKTKPKNPPANFADSRKSQRLDSYLRSIDEERVDLLLVLRLLYALHARSDLSDAILVFLPGYDEIVTLKHLILTDRQFGFRHASFKIFMLHSNIQTGDQRAAFDRPPRNMRKIVLSTNIAESSLTIEDIVFVIDSGKAKEKSFDSMTGVTQLKSLWISKASADQRRGRAGRCRPGVCYRLYSQARYEAMAQFPIPEIIRTSLQELCLQTRLFIKPEMRIERFFTRVIEPPAPIAIKKSVELLKTMGALDEDESLTRLGFHLLEFPLEPFLGKALIYAVVFKCLDPILTLVSIISYRDPFQLPSDPRNKQMAQECKVKFARGTFSDHMAYLKAFQDWEKARLFNEGVERKFCQENYLSGICFDMIYAIRCQLLGQLRAAGFVQNKGKCDLNELNKNSDNWALVKGILVSTLYPNICGVNRDKKALYNSFNSKVHFHPSTTVAKKKDGATEVPTDWVIFDEITQQGPTNLVKGCTCVSTAAIALFAGSFNTTQTIEDPDEVSLIADIDKENRLDITPSLILQINQWISLRGNKEAIESVAYMRSKIYELVIKRLQRPDCCLPADDDIIKTVAAVLVREDETLGFKNVEGIGQWPKFVSGNPLGVPRAGFEKVTTQSASSVRGMENIRYFVMEVMEVRQVVEIIRAGLWVVPETLRNKFAVNNNEEKPQGGNAIIFFWVPIDDGFFGSIQVNDILRSEYLSEVPIKVLSGKTISRQSAEHEVGFKTPSDIPIHGLELDSDLGNALLKLFA